LEHVKVAGKHAQFVLQPQLFSTSDGRKCPVSSAIPSTPIRRRHQRLPCPLRLILQQFPPHTRALHVHKHHQRAAHHDRQPQQDQINRQRVVVERFVGEGVEGGLDEIEESGEADDEAVDFAERLETEDFG
jgi:hypothetical protein